MILTDYSLDYSLALSDCHPSRKAGLGRTGGPAGGKQSGTEDSEEDSSEGRAGCDWRVYV